MFEYTLLQGASWIVVRASWIVVRALQASGGTGGQGRAGKASRGL